MILKPTEAGLGGTLMEWIQKSIWRHIGESDTINWAEGNTAFDWRFKTASDEVFAIKITATVKFGAYAGETLAIVHTATPFIITSLANYWN